MRLAAALAVIAVAWAAAIYVHERHVRVVIPPTGTPKPVCVGSCYLPGSKVVGYTGGTPGSSFISHPSWEDPAAVGLAIGGLAVAAAILTTRRRFAKVS